MSEITLFKCIGNEVESVPEEVLQELGASYQELNEKAEGISKLSRKLKEMKQNSLCRVPFCHTVEAETFGSKVTFDHKYGNRIKEYAMTDLDQISDLTFSTEEGRIAEVLKAVRLLKAQGENVVLELTGPFTIGTSIIDSQTFFKAARKEKTKVEALLSVIEDKLVDLIRLGVEAGADIISITDPAGTMDITGEKIYRELPGPSMVRILERVKDDVGASLIHLCGKTSTSLERMGALTTEKVEVEGQDYFHRLRTLKAARPETALIGHWCMKTRADRSDVVVLRLKREAEER